VFDFDTNVSCKEGNGNAQMHVKNEVEVSPYAYPGPCGGGHIRDVGREWNGESKPAGRTLQSPEVFALYTLKQREINCEKHGEWKALAVQDPSNRLTSLDTRGAAPSINLSTHVRHLDLGSRGSTFSGHSRAPFRPECPVGIIIDAMIKKSTACACSVMRLT